MKPSSERARLRLVNLGVSSLAAAWLFQGAAAVSSQARWSAALLVLGAALVAIGLPEPPPVSRPRRGPVALAALAAFLLLSALPGLRLGNPYAPIVIAAIGWGALWIFPRGSERLSPWVVRAGVVIAILALQAAVSVAVAMLELQHNEVPGIARASALCLTLLGHTGGAEGSTLLLSYADGLHGFRCTAEKLALPFFAQYLAAGWLLRSAAGEAFALRWAWAALIAVAFAIVRFAVVAVVSAHLGGDLRVFCEPIPLLLSLCAFPFLVGRLRAPAPRAPLASPALRERPMLVPLSALAGALFAWGLNGFDPGSLKRGRILIDNAHGNWEDTKVAFDRTSFGAYSVYAYTELVRVLSAYYDVDTIEEGRLTRERLATCDVLVLKTPLQRFDPAEIAAVHDFVEAGGGTLLLGDHTNFLAVNAHLNEVGVPLGIEFRGDQVLAPYSSELFVFHSPAPLLRHPLLGAVETLQTMTGCSFRLTAAHAEAAMIRGPLISEEADYAEMSFFGPGHTDGWDVCGAQRLAATSTHGAGRVAALGDSTIFSNFTMHDRGRSELLLGSVAFLNRSNWLPTWHKAVAELLGWTAFIAVVVLALGALWRTGRPSPLLTVIGSASLGLGVIGLLKQLSYRALEPLRPLPLCNVWIDRSPGVSDGTHRSFINGLARAGLLPRVVDSVEEALEGAEVIVLVRPVTPFSPTLIDRLGDYVERGGRLLLVDDAENRDSTASGLLRAFRMASRESFHGTDLRTVTSAPPFGALSKSGPLLLLDVAQLWARGAPLASSEEGYALRRPIREVAGGTPILNLDEQTVAAVVDRGMGRFCAFTMGFAFCDLAMGDPLFTGLPSDEDRDQYEVLFELVDHLRNGREASTQHGASYGEH